LWSWRPRATSASGVFRFAAVFKILPSFYVFLVVSAVFYNRDTAAIATEAVFLQNYASLTGGRVWYHTWSLVVEEYFNILLPLALLLAARRRIPSARGILTLVRRSGCRVCGAARPSRVATTVAFTRNHEATHQRIDTLIAGVVLGYPHHCYAPSSLTVCTATGGSWSWPPSSSLHPQFVAPLENSWMNVVGTAGLYVAFGILLALVLYEVPMPRWLDASRGRRQLQRVGTDSYNIYLVLDIGMGHLGTIVVEKAILRLRDRLVPRRPPVQTSV
jgi:peptidoglycan/LPS O-acetylase OafA/YrhL